MGEWLEYDAFDLAHHVREVVYPMFKDKDQEIERLERENELLRERIDELSPSEEREAA